METTPISPSPTMLGPGIALCVISLLSFAVVPLHSSAEPIQLILLSWATGIVGLALTAVGVSRAKRDGDRLRVRWGRVALLAALVPLVVSVGFVIWALYEVSQMGSLTLM